MSCTIILYNPHANHDSNEEMNNYELCHMCGKSSSTKAEELRKRVIQESKYLGGDMKHTHLVKGLDYALLQKVSLLF